MTIRFPVMLSAHAEGTAEMYCGHAGPNVVESYVVESSSSLSGRVHLLLPTGGCPVRMNVIYCEGESYLGIWNPLKLSDVCIGIVQVAYERSSPCPNDQITCVVVLRITASTHGNGESHSDQTRGEHLESLGPGREQRESSHLRTSHLLLYRPDKDSSWSWR